MDHDLSNIAGQLARIAAALEAQTKTLNAIAGNLDAIEIAIGSH